MTTFYPDENGIAHVTWEPKPKDGIAGVEVNYEHGMTTVWMTLPERANTVELSERESEILAAIGRVKVSEVDEFIEYHDDGRWKAVHKSVLKEPHEFTAADIIRKKNVATLETGKNNDAEPCFIPEPKDPEPKQKWYVPARYFARKLVEADNRLKNNKKIVSY
ncbi:hypothetical protein [Methylocucumis oryzae]|uniref:Uncharacterized protein n=1 Tax=Methylocucumis oryzae TaxID=1632867 RepID=A0A0F3IGJ3_9GAMM|nr:hypothetical protein [Methylocucumis oryzae]KJV05925.1 hypothetical protein VZ94_14710 [Methylocucumis oryzae]